MATIKRQIFLLEQRSFRCLWSVKLHLKAHVCRLCVIMQPDLMQCKSVFLYVLMVLIFISQGWCICFLAGVTNRLCVCVWARSERSHSSPTRTYLRLHEAKTAPMISFSEHVYSQRLQTYLNQIYSAAPTLGMAGSYIVFAFMLHHSNGPYVAKQPLNSAAS